MLSATTISLLSMVLGALIKGFSDYIIQRQNQVQATTDATEAGKAQEASSINKGTADAERRATDAANNAPDISGTISDLDKGRF